MKKNIGTPDRIVRLIFAILLLFGAYWEHSWILFAVSLFVFYEALSSWCVLYQLLGKDTCNIKK